MFRALLLLAALQPAAANAATVFDGVWAVSMVCPIAPDGTLGYSHQFTAQVADGVLHGETGQSGSPGWVTFEGSIPPGGRATLLAHGLTGRASYAVGRPAELTAYQFHVDAQFSANSGSGERVETRRCSFQFAKRG